jgi:beta-glucosidase
MLVNKTVLICLFICLLGLSIYSGSVSSSSNIPLYKNASAPIESRIEDLIKRMTLEEKLEMMGGDYFQSKPNARLGIPSFKMTDGPLGVRREKETEKATAFPAGIAMGATWNTKLIEQVAAAIARETKGYGKNVLLGPCVNIHRSPMGGRNFESFGEDPYLAARMAVAYVNGIQSEKVIATTKHFACNNQETQRKTIDTIVDERTMHEIYFPAFKAAVQEGNSWAVMAAYNQLNGRPCCASHYLLTATLKERWGFKGTVMSDWVILTDDTVGAALAGLEMEMPKGTFFAKDKLLKAVGDKKIPETIIDDKIRRMLRTMFAMGIFEKEVADGGALNTEEHQKIALDAARESLVLLKNQSNLLPLDTTKIKSIAVFGPNADIVAAGGGSSRVKEFRTISPVQALREKVKGSVPIEVVPGPSLPNNPREVPASALRSDQGNGLFAEYFSNVELKGEPAIKRAETSVNQAWRGENFFEGKLKKPFSTRFSGLLVPEKSGSYLLKVTSRNRTRVYIKNELVIDNWTGELNDDQGIVQLDAEKGTPIRIEYKADIPNAGFQLNWQYLEPADLARVRDAAKKADVAIIFAGLHDPLERETHDVYDLTLPFGQEDLIKAVASVNSKTIVVMNNGTPLLIKNWFNSVPAIVEAWYTGQEGGTAIAELLFGDLNPSGKLTSTFPVRIEDTPAYGNFPGTNGRVYYKEGIFVGYRHYDTKGIKPLLPFGFGLSYSTFIYSNLRIDPKTVGNGGSINVSLDVQNTSSRAGAEVVQLYVKDVKASVLRPEKELKGFEKIWLEPGVKRTVSFKLDQSALAFFDVKKSDWTVEPGQFQILVGASSRDIRLKGAISYK